MNIPLLFASILVFLAAIIHSVIGDKECQILKPEYNDSIKTTDTWVQLRSGWHWVSADLALSALALLLLASTEVIHAKAEVSTLLSIYFFICGVVWLATVIRSKTSRRQIVALGQWIFCFVISALIYFGR